MRETDIMSMSGLPFDDFRALLRELPGPDTHALVAAKERNAQLTKPAGSLGRLEEIAMWLAAWSGRSPAVNRPLVAIFAGNHGVTRHGITPYPSYANFITFRVDGDAKELFDALWKSGVLIRDVSAAVPKSLRVSMGTIDENDRFLELLRALTGRIPAAAFFLVSAPQEVRRFSDDRDVAATSLLTMRGSQAERRERARTRASARSPRRTPIMNTPIHRRTAHARSTSVHRRTSVCRSTKRTAG